MIYRIHTLFIEYQMCTIHLLDIQPKSDDIINYLQHIGHKLCLLLQSLGHKDIRI